MLPMMYLVYIKNDKKVAGSIFKFSNKYYTHFDT